MGKIIATVSGKGGTGKTTTVANLGICLAAFNKKTLVVDLDIGLKNLDLALGMQNGVSYDILDVLDGTCTLEEAIVQNEKYPGLSFVAAAQFKDDSSVTPEKMSIFSDRVCAEYDYILLDCPAGIGVNVTSAISVADIVLIVVNHDPFSLRDGDRIAGIVCENYQTELKLMVNRYKVDLVRCGKMPSILQVVENMAVQLVGAVPDSDAILLSGYSGEPIVLNKRCKVASAYFDAAQRLMGNHIPLLDIPVKHSVRRKNKKE